MLLTGSSDQLIKSFLELLCSEFNMKDLGPVHHFLGMEVITTADGLHLSQTHFALSILKKFQMQDCKSMPSPQYTKHDLNEAKPLADPFVYRSAIGALQYLTLTRPDIAFSVNYASQFMQAPTTSHMKLIHRILRYIKGSLELGIKITKDSTLGLKAYSDADWAGCPTTRRSTTGYCTFLGKNIISWCAKKQSTVSRSSTEAEYRAMAHTAAELTWLTFLLQELRVPSSVPVLYCDNLSSLYLSVNPVLHARSKHIELDYHFVRERVAQGLLITKYVPSAQQLADIFTKSVSKSAIRSVITKLCLSPRHSLRGDNRILRSDKVDYSRDYSRNPQGSRFE
ncbi:hypothetical protein K2173_002237 [Erythroxylum novogranatense]|uniref:Reverse transcriptase Ty1/copia-type domain-containing protein n=1 Tax=Erythroxylum novogranatense TaxID=1862640 RepID=A0AAV8TAH7_9ROSI|nr:hypothetical protein K2173_002237 [Erythroxylum novogranatense]